MIRVVGFKVLSGISKKTGKELDAVVFHCIDETPRDKSFIGKAVMDQYVNGAMARASVEKYGGDYNKAVGKVIKLVYGRSGFLDDVTIE